MANGQTDEVGVTNEARASLADTPTLIALLH